MSLKNTDVSAEYQNYCRNFNMRFGYGMSFVPITTSVEDVGAATIDLNFGYEWAPIYSKNFAFSNLVGNWDDEGYVADPNYEVYAMPEDMFSGLDAQLDKTIYLINADLKAIPTVDLIQPSFPKKRVLEIRNKENKL